jgi:hypothetical protein
MIHAFTLASILLAWQSPGPPPTDTLNNSVRQLIAQSPILLVYCVGILVALIMWKRYPKASICTVIGFLLLLITEVAMVLVQNYLIGQVYERHWSVLDLRNAITITSVTNNLIRAGGYILILAAIYAGRTVRTVNPGFADYRTTRI